MVYVPFLTAVIGIFSKEYNHCFPETKISFWKWCKNVFLSEAWRISEMELNYFWLHLEFLCLKIYLGQEGPCKHASRALLSILQQYIQMEEITLLSNCLINQDLAITALHTSSLPQALCWVRVAGLDSRAIWRSVPIDRQFQMLQKLQTSEVPFSPASGNVQGGWMHISLIFLLCFLTN